MKSEIAMKDFAEWPGTNEVIFCFSFFHELQQKESVERGEENEMIIERILTLIKNVLQIAPGDDEIRADNDATSHDEVNLINNFSVLLHSSLSFPKVYRVNVN